MLEKHLVLLIAEILESVQLSGDCQPVVWKIILRNERHTGSFPHHEWHSLDCVKSITHYAAQTHQMQQPSTTWPTLHCNISTNYSFWKFWWVMGLPAKLSESLGPKLKGTSCVTPHPISAPARQLGPYTLQLCCISTALEQSPEAVQQVRDLWAGCTTSPGTQWILQHIWPFLLHNPPTGLHSPCLKIHHNIMSPYTQTTYSSWKKSTPWRHKNQLY